jgi:hypothetical protein
MTPQTGYAALVLATGFAGLLAGASADRYLVQVPAWRHLDVMTWAEHSRSGAVDSVVTVDHFAPSRSS